jgi:hypothetical protein
VSGSPIGAQHVSLNLALFVASESSDTGFSYKKQIDRFGL